MLTDPISDMLTRIRNAGSARMMRVAIPESRMKREIARVLKERGYISGYETDGDEKRPTLLVELRYDDASAPLIEGIERVSKPGRRVYVRSTAVPRVRNGLGIAIMSTPRGIMTDEQAREAGIGGEVLARVW